MARTYTVACGGMRQRNFDSGNSSDKETIVEAMKRLKENIEFPDDVYFIADSSLYSEDNVKALKDMKWITRVPSTINLCKELLISDLEFKQGRDSRYSFLSRSVYLSSLWPV